MVKININNFLVILSSNNSAEKNPKYMQYVVSFLNIHLYMCVCLCVVMFIIYSNTQILVLFFFLSDSVRFVTQPELHFLGLI